MPAALAKSTVKSIEIEAVVTRADGSVEDLGVVSAYYRNPFKRLLARFRHLGEVRF